MSIRLTALYLMVAGLSIYAWKDWFKSLCGLIVLTAIIGHPDFSQSAGNIQGLNIWNILFANVFLAWLLKRRHHGFDWDMPRHINILLSFWLFIVLAGWLWMMFDRGPLVVYGYTTGGLISEQLINTVKWPLVCLPLFDGCRTQHRVKAALVCIIILFGLFMVQMAKSVPVRAAVEPGNIRIRKNLVTDVGISPNGAAKMMSGVPWAMLALLPLIGKRKHGLLLIGLCIGGVYALALTGGRSGFAACGATFVLLCLVRWRRYLVVLPVLVVVATIAFPGAAARMTTGFDQTTVSGEEFTNFDDVTSGRVFIWPVAISKVCESPLFGFGRNAMTRTGARQFLADEYGEESGRVVSHPHNAYLEVLLDSGLIGLVVVVGFHLCIWVYSIRLFRDRYDALYASVGGFTLSLLTGHLVSFMGGQSFYPEEIDVGLWCAMGVVLRVYEDRTRRLAKAYWSNGDPSIENRQWQTACGPSWGAIVDHG